MRGAPLPPDYETWQSRGGEVIARRDVAPAVRAALEHGTLYAWAAAQAPRDVFQGRGETYGVALGPVRAVVRHARRGGLVQKFSQDRFVSAAPRFRRELAMSIRLRAAGIATPAFLAGVSYPAGIAHTADVATERVDGRDLVAIFFGDDAPTATQRTTIWTDVANLVRRLHDAGFVHPDLQLRNVLIPQPASPPVPQSPSPQSPCLLDVDTVRCPRLRPKAARRANIKRFLRSWARVNAALGPRLTAGDRAAFLSAYDPGLRL